MKLLYIEDNVDVRRSVLRMLRLWYDIEVDEFRIADSADEAIAHIRDCELGRGFDFVLSDFDLRGPKTGLDVLMWVREHVSRLEDRFLFLSGNPDFDKSHLRWVVKGEDPKVLRAAIDDMLTKPVLTDQKGH